MNRSLLKKGFRPLVAWTGVAVLFAAVAIAQNGGAPAGQS